MKITRRSLACSGALALAAISLSGSPLFAQSTDEASLNQAMEGLRQAMLDANKARLEELTADQLSYGHSAGRIESKAEFVGIVAGKKTIYKSIALQEPTTAVVGDNAIARHIFVAETESNGKQNSARVGVLQVWTKQEGRWKLLARQAFRI